MSCFTAASDFCACGGLAGIVVVLYAGPGVAFLLRDQNPVSIIRQTTVDCAPVSGWYGPGAWISFAFSICLALWNTFRSMSGSDEGHGSWDVDLLVAFLYTAMAAGDLVRRCIHLLSLSAQLVPSKDIPALAAAATVVHVSFGLALVPVMLGVHCYLEQRSSPLLAPLNKLIFHMPKRPSASYKRRVFVWLALLLVAFTTMCIFEHTLMHITLPNPIQMMAGREIISGQLGELPATGSPPPPELFTTGPFIARFPAWVLLNILHLRGPFFAGAGLILAFYGLCVLGLWFIWDVHPDPSLRGRALSGQQRWASLAPALVALGLQFATLAVACVGWIVGWCMLVPGTPGFPDSGVGITEMDQLGALLAAALVQGLRAAGMARRARGRRTAVWARTMELVVTAWPEVGEALAAPAALAVPADGGRSASEDV